MTLTSRFHPINAILVPAFLVLLFVGLGCFGGFLSFLEVETGLTDSIFKTPIYGSLLLVAGAFGIIFHYLKILKKVRISDQGMQFQSLFKVEFIPWENVRKIELMGKTNGNGFVAPLEATILELKDGQKFELLASFYKNIGALRKSLEQVAESLENESSIEISPVSESPFTKRKVNVDLDRMTKHSGHHLLSFNGAIIYGWVSFSVYSIFLQSPNFPSLLGLVILTLLSGIVYGFLGHQLHYFYLGKDYLVVKNHVWPWVNQVYRIDNIKQVVFEVPYRRSFSLRIITDDYQSRLFPAGSLKKKNWKALLRQLQDLGLDIRNETSLEPPISSNSRI
jgi:hypothetical protein